MAQFTKGQAVEVRDRSEREDIWTMARYVRPTAFRKGWHVIERPGRREEFVRDKHIRAAYGDSDGKG